MLRNVIYNVLKASANNQISVTCLPYLKLHGSVKLHQIHKFSTDPPTPANENPVGNTTAELPLLDLSPEMERKLKVLQLELSVMRQDGRRVPDPQLMKPAEWQHLLELKSRSGRDKYYSFLFIKEKTKESQKRKKEENRIVTAAKIQALKDSTKDDHIIYALRHNTLFLRLYDSTINFWQNNKLSRAMQFGEKLIIDCSYDEHMVQREAINAAKQLMLSFSDNRNHDQPFDLLLCNSEMSGTTMKYLERHIPCLTETWFPLNIHEQSYMDLFPKERLVYLTPHCRTDLVEYNPDDVYIIGAMVDKLNNEPISLAKAKRLGLRMARLPLDQYIQWGAGSGKSLTINQMVKIMLDIKTTNDWNYSLRHVPRRKVTNDQVSEQKKWTKSASKFTFHINNVEESGVPRRRSLLRINDIMNDNGEDTPRRSTLRIEEPMNDKEMIDDTEDMKSKRKNPFSM